jgi:hypothetical protein
MFADPAAEDHADFVGLSDRSIGIEQSLSEVIQCCTTTEDEIVAELVRAPGDCDQPLRLIATSRYD